MKVALIQAAPVFLNREKTVEKMLGLMEDAAHGNADLCVFPETFLPGYPRWVFLHNSAVIGDEDHKGAYNHYLRESVYIDGPEIRVLTDKADKLGLCLVTGVAERTRTNSTIYCSMLSIVPGRGVVNVHRKLISTLTERTVWGRGDGAGLRVFEYGDWRIGGLNCWENWMPLSRFSLYAQGENVHIGIWPGDSLLSEDITRFIALEGRMYSLAVGGLLRPDDIPDSFHLKEAILREDSRLLNGGSCAWGPDGTELFPLSTGVEDMFLVDLDISRVNNERRYFDPAGHYNEPSVFNLTVNTDRLEHVHFKSGKDSSGTL